MKKTITICDNCKRQLNEGEQFVTRAISSSNYDTRVEDVCMCCAYPNNSTAGGIDSRFLKIINDEFWNIL